MILFSYTDKLYISKWCDTHEKLIEPIVFLIQNLKINNKKDIAALAFWDCFCSSHQPNEIGPTAENNAAAIPLTLFFLDVLHKWGHAKLLDKRLWPKVRFAPNYIFLCRPLSPISFFSKNSYYHHHQEPNLTWRSPSRISKYSSFPTKVIFT